MRFFHLADLHIGRSLNNVSLLEDQRHILKQVLELAREYKPDALLISGDVYDKAQPSAGAVALYDEFLTDLAAEGLPTLIISGNHDSPERLDFGSRLFKASNLHICGAFPGTIPLVKLEDAYGEVNFHLLPFVKPSITRRFFPDAPMEDCSDAVKAALTASPPDSSQRNVLLAHQFVAGDGLKPERSDSEYEPVGGLNAVDPALFAAYDYVALGHLHGRQRVGCERVRYAGSPLKYSFSEYRQHKAVTLIELGGKKAEDGLAELTETALPLTPLRDARRLRGPFEELTSPLVLAAASTNDFVQITLTDEVEILDALSRLKKCYPNLLELRFDNTRSRAEADFSLDADIDGQSPEELFTAFYREQNGANPSEAQQKIARTLMNDLDIDQITGSDEGTR